MNGGAPKPGFGAPSAFRPSAATPITGSLRIVVGRRVSVSPVPARQPSIRSGRNSMWRRPWRRVRSRCSSSVKATLTSGPRRNRHPSRPPARPDASVPPNAHPPADPSRSLRSSRHERTARRLRTGSLREPAAAPRSDRHPARTAHHRPTAGITTSPPASGLVPRTPLLVGAAQGVGGPYGFRRPARGPAVRGRQQAGRSGVGDAGGTTAWTTWCPWSTSAP